MMTIALALALLGGDCRKFGTAIEWEESVEAARVRAEKEGKLVLVLHVSGRFEDPAFTWNNAQALRVGALSNADVGAFVGRNFIAAWKKVGTFQIVKNGDALRNVPRDVKVGGNVAAYFCTPDLRVVNAVLGNVRAETFLEEARRAVEIRELVRGACPEEAEPLLARVHEEIPYPVTWSRTPETVTHAVHATLARKPLPALETVYREFFEGLLGEEVSDRDVEVVTAGNFLLRLNDRSGRGRRNP